MLTGDSRQETCGEGTTSKGELPADPRQEGASCPQDAAGESLVSHSGCGWVIPRRAEGIRFALVWMLWEGRGELGLPAPSAGGLGSASGQGASSHLPQGRVRTPQRRRTISHATR